MAQREVKVGIVGVGSMGQAHVRALKEIPNARLVAVCDRDGGLAQAAAEPIGAAAYTDGAEMMAVADVEAVYICVPPHSHEDLEVRAAARGLHLFVEKPVSLYMDEALRARDAIRAAGVISQVGYQCRYWPQFQQLHALLAGRDVGAASVCRWGGAPGKDWWRRYDQGGGQLVEMTTHQVDMLRWVMGEVEAVSASYSFERLFKGEVGTTVPDSQSVLLRFVSGASAVISTVCAVGKASLTTMDFALKNGKVSLKGEAIVVEPEGALPVPPLEPARTADEMFIGAVASGDGSQLLSPYDDGIKTAAVTLAANRSAEEGGRLVPLSELMPGWPSA